MDEDRLFHLIKEEVSVIDERLKGMKGEIDRGFKKINESLGRIEQHSNEDIIALVKQIEKNTRD